MLYNSICRLTKEASGDYDFIQIPPHTQPIIALWNVAHLSIGRIAFEHAYSPIEKALERINQIR